jgi:hypothetical protein
MAVAAARAMGAAEVSLEARYPHQIELGERLGATQPLPGEKPSMPGVGSRALQ